MDERKTSSIVSGLSAGIIVYVLAGGKFTGQGNLIIGAVKFANPDVVIGAVVLLFFYWFLRLKLGNHHPIRAVSREVHEYLIHDDRFRKSTEKLIRESINPEMDGIEVGIDDIKVHHSSEPTRAFEKLGRSAKYRYELYSISKARAIARNQSMELPTRFYWKHMLISSIKHDVFFQHFTPWVLASIATICIVYRFINWLT